MLRLEISSSDIWVIDNSAHPCSSGDCLTPFNPNSSQSISTVDAGGFDILYYSGEYATGDYITEQFALGTDQARVVVEMGLATKLTDSTAQGGGYIGIGYDSIEAASHPYPNFIDQMFSHNLINTKLYSLWLNVDRSSNGSILFGGIDTEKYYGTLYSMPVHPDSTTGNYTYFIVGLTSISITSQIGSTFSITNASYSTTVALAASIANIRLSSDIVDAIYSQFDVSVFNGTAYVDCKYSNSSHMSFGFESGSIINVAYSEIINKNGMSSPVPTTLPFSDVCVMAIDITESGELFILGTSFLRSTYAVFDLTNNRVGIAHSVLNSTTSNVIEIPVGAASIPQSTGVALPSPTTASPTSSIVSATASSTSTSTSMTSPAPHNNHAVEIGVGVAIPVFAVLSAILAFSLWYRRRHASQTAARVVPTPELDAPSLPVSVANWKMRPSPTENEIHYGALPVGSTSPRSDMSELPSGNNVASAPPPGYLIPTVERGPATADPDELHFPMYQGSVRPVSTPPPPNVYYGEQRSW